MTMVIINHLERSNAMLFNDTYLISSSIPCFPFFFLTQKYSISKYDYPLAAFLYVAHFLHCFHHVALISPDIASKLPKLYRHVPSFPM
jgi:hypothetical protein